MNTPEKAWCLQKQREKTKEETGQAYMFYTIHTIAFLTPPLFPSTMLRSKKK